MTQRLYEQYVENYPEMVELNYILSAAQLLGSRFNFTGDMVEYMYHNDRDKLEWYLLAAE